MARKKTVPEEKDASRYSWSECVVNNTAAPANEFTRDAVVALAKASEAHANALIEIARALKGGDTIMENGFRIG